MPKLCGRILFLILSLMPIQYIFAATVVYVNVNNPTPGDGSTWAKAFTDLNAAIAVTPSYGEIWVAQGTYKPTSTNNRTIAFETSKYLLLYGGFNGTEVNRTDRDSKVNITILSGDIGVPGNASDNSYNVIRLTPTNVFGTIIDGFTIRDGNANKDYPGSTTLQPYNQGAGVSVIYYNPTYIGAAEAGGEVDNCIFTNNFAVYGGAIGNYADGTGGVSAYTQLDVRNTVFDNNTAVMGGGAIATLVINAALTDTRLQNCLFVNNHSAPGTASAILSLTDNVPAWSPTSNDVLNCVFYNNDAPVMGNTLLNGGKGSLNCTYSIIWQSSGPYADNTFNEVPGVSLYGSNDIRINNAPTGNINSDPQFKDAAAGDFHVSPCSPVIDYNYNSYSSYPFDFDLNPRPVGNADIGLYETTRTVPSTLYASTASYCEGATVSADLSGHISNITTGATLNWYDDASLSSANLLSGAPTASTTTVGSAYYYVTQTIAGGCPSNAVKLTVTINDTPDEPTVTTPLGYCQNATAPQLSVMAATGNILRWYADATTTAYTNTPPTPNTGTTTSSTSPLTYFVSQRGPNNCESQRAEIDVNIGAKPLAPVTTAIAYCQGAAADVLDADADPGATLTWYSDATTTTSLAGAPTPATTSATSTGTPQTYYVSQTALGCESNRAELDVTINPSPVAPTTTNTSLSYCQGITADDLDATGASLTWYDAASGGTASSVAPQPSTASVGSTSYYVSQTVSGCESDRLAIDVTVNSIPDGPDTDPIAYCQNDNAAALTPSGSDLLWYATATSGTGSNAAPIPATTTGGSTTYYVSKTGIGTCESARSPLTVTVNANPSVVISAVNKSFCKGTTVPLQASGATTYVWAPQAGLSGVTSSSTTATVLKDVQYTVTGTDDNGCIATAKVDLHLNDNCGAYIIPTAFSPNGDGLNDLFRVNTPNAPKSFVMEVLNRYGGRIFIANDINVGWDGTQNGKLLDLGAYVYVVVITTSEGDVINKTGTVMLVR